MNDLLQLFSQYGFPVVVSAYLLVRLDKRLSELTEAIQRVAMICEALERK